MVVPPASQQDLTSILSHSSNLSAGSQSSLSSLLMKNHPPPLPLLNSETLPYLKSSQSFTEELDMLGISLVDDHHLEYDPKMKLSSSVFDDDCDVGLMAFGQPDMKMFDSGNQCMKVREQSSSAKTKIIERERVSLLKASNKNIIRHDGNFSLSTTK